MPGVVIDRGGQDSRPSRMTRQASDDSGAISAVTAWSRSSQGLVPEAISQGAVVGATGSGSGRTQASSRTSIPVPRSLGSDGGAGFAPRPGAPPPRPGRAPPVGQKPALLPRKEIQRRRR